MYKEHLDRIYSHQYANAQYNIAIKYLEYLDNPSKILSLPTSIRGNILKGLVCLARYLGKYEEFSRALKQHGIKWITVDSFKAFLSITNNNHEDLVKWLKDYDKALPDNERLFIKYTLISGLRRAESIKSFNRIIDLSQQNRLSEYYNTETQILEHFRFKDNLRHTKNCYVTVLDKTMLTEICNSKHISYTMIRRHLAKNRLRLRIKDLRSFNNTFLRKHGLMSECIDLLSGRIPTSVFARNYLKQSLSDLSAQVLPIQNKMLEIFN